MNEPNQETHPGVEVGQKNVDDDNGGDEDMEEEARVGIKRKAENEGDNERMTDDPGESTEEVKRSGGGIDVDQVTRELVGEWISEIKGGK